ncbi:unnamed protein product [Phaeothamnion confervicola]
MGILLSRFYDMFVGLREKRILMLGLDGAGKTTTLYKMHLNECVHTVATIGFNVERVTYKKFDMTIWDVGGQEKIRRLWRHYYSNTDALVFVVDSADTERIDEARYELETILSDPEMDTCRNVLILANKADLPSAASAQTLVEKLGLSDPRGVCGPARGRSWYLQSCCAKTGDGLFEGMDWLSTALRRAKTVD